MASYPSSGSTMRPNISTGLSTQIVIKVGTETVGAIQNLNINQTRALYRTRELGLDGILEIVPNNATEYTASVTRVVFDRLRLPEAFARGFVNIKSQLLPFDILIIDRTNGDGDSAISHRLVNCWFNTYNPKYEANDFIISEESSIYFEDISTTLGSSDASAVQGGDRGINFVEDERERDTDRGSGGSVTGGGFRGTMDVADISGITKAAFGLD